MPAQKLSLLRALLDKHQLGGMIVPMADAFQNEYIPDDSKRLQWLTGFTGSAGLLIVLEKTAALFVDSRYTVQAKQAVNTSLFQLLPLERSAIKKFIETHQSSSLAYDPWNHTENDLAFYEEFCTLVPLEHNLVDECWVDRPKRPCMPVRLQDLKYAGTTFEDKLKKVAHKLTEHQCDMGVMSEIDNLAWLLNMRGNDVECNPLFLAYGLVSASGTLDVFSDIAKFSTVTLPENVHLYSFEEFPTALQQCAGKTVLIDPNQTPHQIVRLLDQAAAKLHRGQDPCGLLKAVKNPTEIKGMREALVRDGAILCKFLHWIDTWQEHSPNLDELQAVDYLLKLRQEDPLYTGLSFETISALGPNAALPHYHSTKATNRPFVQDAIYLCDSGGQYLDGTTDVTRTITLGTPTQKQREHFTRVLKGHVSLATAQFPHGTSGAQLDAFARRFLWEVGLDFGHGTGHGVGAHLCVHEGPQRISKFGFSVPLENGMILSNEPGYYEEGAYGIRIENLVIVQGASTPLFHSFETITLAPIDRHLIEVSMLTTDELSWLNAYHEKVYQKISPLINGETQAWLYHATRPLML